MIGYLLLTYGKRPSSSPEASVAGRRQFRNIEQFFESVRGADVLKNAQAPRLQIYYDYCRKTTRLGSLPTLTRILNAVGPAPNAIVIDDASILFRACAPSSRDQLVEELHPISERLFSLRHQKNLAELDDIARTLWCHGHFPPPFRLTGSPRTARDPDVVTTSLARAATASRRVRSAKADMLAVKVASVRDELANEGLTAFTNQAIADALNGKGITTSRGNPWSAKTVRDALIRVDQKQKDSLARRPFPTKS